MNPRFVARALFAGIFVAGIAAVPAPARAQTAMGSVHGHVLDEAGKPVVDADISYDCVGDQKLHFTGKTDAKGEYNRGGLQLGACIWSITVTKGPLKGTAANLDIAKGNAMQVPDITMHAAGAGGAGGSAEMTKTFNDVKALVAQNNFDGAVTELQGFSDKNPKCSQCLVRLGDTYYKKANASTADADKQAALDSSEKAYQAAIAIDDKSKDAADAYGGLVDVYNSEKRFDDAGKANDKATALMAAAPAAGGAAAGGGNDATGAYNAGVILYNQSKMTEAEAQFAKAVQLKPDMADAQYYLGMCLISEGKVDDAKKALQQYLKLAPNGANAEIAKSVIDMK